MSQSDKDNQKEIKQEWINLFKRENQEEIVKAIEDKDLEQIIDKEFINEMKTLTNDKKIISYINTFEDEIKDHLGVKEDITSFKIEKYKDLSKARLAQEMADFSVYQLNIHPVDVDKIGEQTELYQYNQGTGLWEYFPKNHIGRIVKDMGKKQFTRHLQREFKLNIYNHSEFLDLERMGLPENEILIKNKKKLILNTEEYQTEEVKKQDQALYKVNASYNPNLKCPEWKKLVRKTLNGEENQIKTLQEFMGWLLKYPNRDHKKALLILGVKDSGKSQIAEVMEHMFNPNAVSSLSMAQIGMERRFHIDKVGDSILNIDKDMQSVGIEANDTIKTLIAQEKLAVEPKGEDSFTIDPQAKFVFCSNVAPKPNISDDAAFFGRFITLKAPNAVPKEEQVADLGRKIYKKEKEGILNWMLEGLERLEEQGRFTLEPSAYETKLMWNEYGNSVNRFVWDCIEQGDSEDFIPTEDLYEEYEIWISDKLQRKKSFSQFVHEIKKQPFIEKKRKSHKGSMRMCFEGCKVVTDSGNLETNPE